MVKEVYLARVESGAEAWHGDCLIFTEWVKIKEAEERP
jgi:hypothetical protein